MLRHDTVDIRGVYYIPDGDSVEANPEAVAFPLRGGVSVLFTTATDWTLRLGREAWNRLPKWCHPAEQWEYRPIPGVTPECSLRRSSGLTELRNEVGEIVGVTIIYEEYVFEVRAGEPFSVTRRAR